MPEQTDVPIEALMEGAPHQTKEEYALLLDATNASFNLLKELPDFRLLPPILNSTRRVCSVFYGSKYLTNDGYTNPENVLNRIEDILYDLEHYTGYLIPENIVTETIRIFPKLEFIYGEFTEYSTKQGPVPGAYKRITPDLARINVTRSIWWKWEPGGEDIVNDVVTLRRCIVGRIRYLYQTVIRYESRRTETFFLNEFDDLPKLKSLNFWYESIQHLSLSEVFGLLNAVPVEYSLHILIHFKYLHAQKPVTEILAEKNISQFTHDKRLREGLQMILDLAFSPSNYPLTTHLKWLLLHADINGVSYLKGEVLPVGNLRQQFSAQAYSPAYRAKLTDAEQSILRYLIVRDGARYIHSIDDISNLTHYARATVILAINTLSALLAPAEKSYVYTSGYRISQGSIQARLIGINPTPEQLVVLSPKQREFFQLITTPDRNGRYLSTTESRQKMNLSRKDIPHVIEQKFNTTSWVIELQKQMTQLLNDTSLSLSEDQERYINYVLFCIEAGVSVGAERIGTIGKTFIIKQLEISPTVINQVNRLLKEVT